MEPRIRTSTVVLEVCRHRPDRRYYLRNKRRLPPVRSTTNNYSVYINNICTTVSSVPPTRMWLFLLFHVFLIMSKFNVGNGYYDSEMISLSNNDPASRIILINKIQHYPLKKRNRRKWDFDIIGTSVPRGGGNNRDDDRESNNKKDKRKKKKKRNTDFQDHNKLSNNNNNSNNSYGDMLTTTPAESSNDDDGDDDDGRSAGRIDSDDDDDDDQIEEEVDDQDEEKAPGIDNDSNNRETSSESKRISHKGSGGGGGGGGGILPSLFQLNNAIKEDTSSSISSSSSSAANANADSSKSLWSSPAPANAIVDEETNQDDDGNGDMTVTNHRHKQKDNGGTLLGATTSAKNGRGGALVKTAIPKQQSKPKKQRNIFFDWLTPSSSNDELSTQNNIDGENKIKYNLSTTSSAGSSGTRNKNQQEESQHYTLDKLQSSKEEVAGENEIDGDEMQRRKSHDYRPNNNMWNKIGNSNQQEGKQDSSAYEASGADDELTDLGRVHYNDDARKSSQQQMNAKTDTEQDSTALDNEIDSISGNDYFESNIQITGDESIKEIAQESAATLSSLSEKTTLSTTDTLSPSQDWTAEDASPFISSGYWQSIDRALTFGYASKHPGWRISSKLRPVRKATARLTGLHGLLSGKKITANVSSIDESSEGIVSLNQLMRRRIAAIDRARLNVEEEERRRKQSQERRGRWFFFGSKQQEASDHESHADNARFNIVVRKSKKEVHEERKRKERVKEIDRLMTESQQTLQKLACEKDVLQRRHNPLWNYTIEEKRTTQQNRQQEFAENTPEFESASMDASNAEISLSTSRRFCFPPPDLVDEYLDMFFSSGRLEKLNHTDLWRNSNDDDDDDDELASSTNDFDSSGRKRRNMNGGSGNWLLRHGLGEKIGVGVETAAYKAACAGVMSFLARTLSSLHGVNVMHYSDIRLYVEQAPELPPLAAGIIPGSGKHGNYAQGAIENAMRRGVRKRRRRHARMDSFIQRDAVVETLLSQCQIAAPLLKLFPIAWQRAMLANCINMITAIFADFFEGLEFQILGHRLSFVFSPITEADMLRNLGSIGEGLNRNRPRPEQFEAAVQATAETLAEELKFLDKWHERLFGGGVLRAQIANLIARLVLSLTGDVLRGARMDLWTAQAGGPRLLAGLEYRTTPNYMDEVSR